MLWYTKIIIYLVKDLKIVENPCLYFISFHDDFCYCVEYSNVEDQAEINNT